MLSQKQSLVRRMLLLSQHAACLEGRQGYSGTPAGSMVLTLPWRMCNILTAVVICVQALKPGGRVVYSTCSILPLENDDVVLQVLASWQGDDHISISPGLLNMADGTAAAMAAPVPGVAGNLLQLLSGEKTKHGFIILPDGAASGPMYVSVLCKH